MRKDLEYKVFQVNNASVGDTGYGFVEGYGNTVYSVDRYGDIILEYKGLEALVNEGFVTDTHGLPQGNMGDYTYEGQYGTIGSAKVDEKGLFVHLDFYKEENSQRLRSKIEDRVTRNKNVYFSIGWKPDEPPIFIYPAEYKSLLPKYLPADKVQAAIDKAMEYKVPRLRLLKANVGEIAFAPRPVNTESALTTFKNEAMEKITFDGLQFKSEFLGEEIEDRIAISALDTLYYRLRDSICRSCIPNWNTYGYSDGTPMDSDSEDESLESEQVIGAIDEFSQIAKGVFAKMQELEAENAGMSEEQSQEKALRVKGIIEFKAQWTAKFIDSLPDSSFAYIEKGGKKDSDGKTTPRSLRHFPYKDKNGKPDAAHVRNALARIPQSKVSDAAKQSALKKVQAAAKELGIGKEKEKSFTDEFAEYKTLIVELRELKVSSPDEFKSGATHSKATKEKLSKLQEMHANMKQQAKDMSSQADEAYDCVKEMIGDESEDEEKAYLDLLEMEFQEILIN